MFKENNKAIYLQIADTIAERILAGSLSPGERLPSVREYAASVQVNPNTMMRTYESLSQQGLIYNRRGIGFFVADDAPDTIARMKREEFLNGEKFDMFRQFELLKVSPDELKSKYIQYLQR